MSEDSSFNRDQKKEEERSVVPDFSGSLGKGMLAKEKKEILGKSSGLTPLGFGVNDSNRIMDGDSAGVGFSTTEYAENTEMPGNSSGLTPLRPFEEIYSINQKSPLAKGFSAIESLETLRKSSGLTPLGLDSELQIKAPGVSPLEGICARRAEKPQDFGLDERRYSPHRTKSSALTDFDQKGE